MFSKSIGKKVVKLKMNNENRTGSVKAGISFGCALAIVISYVKWHSIFWAIIHGCFSWLYVIYFILKGY